MEGSSTMAVWFVRQRATASVVLVVAAFCVLGGVPASAKKKGGPLIPVTDPSLGKLTMSCRGSVSNPSRDIKDQYYTTGVSIDFGTGQLHGIPDGPYTILEIAPDTVRFAARIMENDLSKGRSTGELNRITGDSKITSTRYEGPPDFLWQIAMKCKRANALF